MSKVEALVEQKLKNTEDMICENCMSLQGLLCNYPVKPRCKFCKDTARQILSQEGLVYRVRLGTRTYIDHNGKEKKYGAKYKYIPLAEALKQEAKQNDD